jgi:hypothetical protein
MTFFTSLDDRKASGGKKDREGASRLIIPYLSWYILFALLPPLLVGDSLCNRQEIVLLLTLAHLLLSIVIAIIVTITVFF